MTPSDFYRTGNQNLVSEAAKKFEPKLIARMAKPFLPSRFYMRLTKYEALRHHIVETGSFIHLNHSRNQLA